VTFFETEHAVIDGFTIRNGSGKRTLVVTMGVFPPPVYIDQWSEGGGIYCEHSSPTITNCIISGNMVEGFSDCMGFPTWMNKNRMISEKGISKVYSHAYGGGIYCVNSSPTITNCTISGNDSLGEPGNGGGIYYAYSSPTITNCTISGNSASDYGGGIYLNDYYSSTITNSILWGNMASTGSEIIGSPIVTYSDVQGGWMGEGNIDEDPLFIGAKNYHLSLGSPCIDGGTDAGVYVDIDGQPRPYGFGFDMGSDEYTRAYWTLELDSFFMWGFLNLDFTLGTPEPALWSTSLILTFPTMTLIPLWLVPLPVIYSPVEMPISFPFPSMGLIAISSSLYADIDLQPEAFDSTWVWTGW